MRNRILSMMFSLTALAVLLAVFAQTAVSYRLFEEQVLDDLSVSTRVCAKMVESIGTEAAMDAFEESYRVTLIRQDGVVLMDSQADAQRMENHANRPEFLGAAQHGEGQTVRASETMARSEFYYAVRLADGSVLRLARQGGSIMNVYRSVLPVMLLLLALLLALSYLLARTLAKRLIYPIEQLTQRLGDENAVAAYPELEPFINMIEIQHEEILRTADMRVQFTANVSHELKTPLTSISGYAELIESGMAQGEQAKAFSHEIRRSADRLLTLINDIIRLSQMDSPMTEMKLEAVDLAQVARETMEQLTLSARKLNVTLHQTGSGGIVRADRRMMEELVYNLCDNAIRYNVSGGSVTLDVQTRSSGVVLTVADTGIGISPEHQEHIFERFYRVDKSRSKATGGTGLGLAIVKHIAAKHEAKLEIESELGRGTKIRVVFSK